MLRKRPIVSHRLRGKLFLLLFLLWPSWLYVQAPVKHVIIVSVDGLRPDAITAANAPNLRSLTKVGSYSWQARTIFPSTTLPSHTSMLTGLAPEKHKMVENTWEPGQGYVEAVTVFELVKISGLRTAAFVGKEKLGFLAKEGSLDRYETLSSSAKIGKAVISYLVKEKPNLLFIHFAEADYQGHAFGWMSREYLRAVKKIDRLIGEMIMALKKAGLNQKALVIITADHGGHDRTHGSDDPRDMTIPWIALGPGIKRNYEVIGPIVTFYTAATALYALGIEIPPYWDGQPVLEIFLAQQATLGELALPLFQP